MKNRIHYLATLFLYFVLFCGLSPLSYSKIFLDYETDPLPLIKINFVLPAKEAFKVDTENLGLKILEECFESGTLKLDKQKYQDLLASYGASLEISAGQSYQEINLTFPLSGGKVPEGLIQLTKDSIGEPRITEEAFERARKLLKANFISTLERDSSLLISAMNRYMGAKLFNFPFYETTTFDRVSISNVQDLHKNYYNNSNIWMGVIAPKELKEEVRKLSQRLFSNSGDIEEGMLETELKSGFMLPQTGKISPTFILIDKKDLAQIDYGFIRVAHQKKENQHELTDKIINYLLTRAGIDSIYGRKIRAEKGLAYQVSGIYTEYLDFPVISLFSNPQRSKQKEAVEVLSDLVKSTFDKADLINTLPDPFFNGKVLSYKNSERQDGATPDGRLHRRKDVATNDMSFDFYKSNIDSWNVSKAQATKRLTNFTKSSSMVMGIIGDTNELEPLIKKSFPKYQLVKISYKDVLENTWLK
jgi:hypothetical protein